MLRTPPDNKVIWPQMSVVLRLRNSTVRDDYFGEAGGRHIKTFPVENCEELHAPHVHISGGLKELKGQ